MAPLPRAEHGVGALPVAAAALAAVALLALDVVVGLSYVRVDLPALAAGAVAGMAVVVASRALLPATLAAATASLLVSYVGLRGGAAFVLGRPGPALPGVAEIVGLACLACWSLRSLTGPRAVVVGTSVAAATAGIVARHGDTGYQPLVVVGVGLAMALAASAGLYLRWLDHDRLRGLDQARQQERLEIARELHDVVAHHVTGIVVQAQAAQAVWDDRPTAARAAVAEIEAAGAEALGSMRRLVGTLRADGPGERAPTATLDELQLLADRSGALGLPVRLEVERVPADLPADLAASVHRIVRESLTNARRHAEGATAVDVRVVGAGDRLTLAVQDDGAPAGGRRPPTGGYGLTGMTERAEALGGWLRAGPTPDRGWLVQAELPIRRP